MSTVSFADNQRQHPAAPSRRTIHLAVARANHDHRLRFCLLNQTADASNLFLTLVLDKPSWTKLFAKGNKRTSWQLLNKLKAMGNVGGARTEVES